MKTLIIDDNKLSAEIESSILSQYGYVNICNDSIEGLSEYERSVRLSIPYDLICLDLIMPKYSGYDILNQIRNFEKSYNTKAVIVIIVSSFSEDKLISDAYSFGANKFITKPLNIEELENYLLEVGLITEDQRY